jgi:uncharacterized caspase-like protein
MMTRCLCLALLWFLSAGLFAADFPKAVGRVQPLSPKQWASLDSGTEGSAGLFIGIAKFDEVSGLPQLRYTVDDAIRLADLFVTGLGLLPAANTQLALGGEPNGEASRERLQKLKALGVKVTGATKTELLDALRDVAGRARDPKGMVVVALSTHGFEEKGLAYVMPTDGRQDELEESGIKIETIRSRLEKSAKPTKKLLIVDACREVPVGSVKGVGKLPPAFVQAFREAKGFAVLTACAPGEQSWEDPDLGHGVFTAQLCNAFEAGGAAGGPDGFVRLGSVMTFASEATKDYVDRKRRQVQSPNYSGDESARQIPLAFDTERGKLTDRKTRNMGLLGAAVIAGPEITAALQGEITDSLRDTVEVNLLERLLTRLETLADNTPDNRRDLARFWELERSRFGFRTKPRLVAQPASQKVKAGKEARFRVRAEGNGLHFAWESRRANAPWQTLGGDDDTLDLSGIAAADDGLELRVRVRNAEEEVISDTVRLTVERSDPPRVTDQPRSVTVKTGEAASFRVRAEGTALAYRWETRRGGGAWERDSAGGDELRLARTVPADNGLEVRVTVANADGEVRSETARLTVQRRSEPKITTQPRDVKTRVGETARFRVQATGGNLAYRWETRRQGGGWEPEGGDENELKIGDVSSFERGLEVRVTVTDGDAEVRSQTARLTFSSYLEMFAFPGKVFDVVNNLVMDGNVEVGRFVNPAPGYKYQIEWKLLAGGGFSQVTFAGEIVSVFPAGPLRTGTLFE